MGTFNLKIDNIYIFFKRIFPTIHWYSFMYIHVFTLETCINLDIFLKFRVIFVAFFLQVWRKVYFQYLLLERNIPVIAATEYFSGQNGRLLNLDISNRGLPVCQDSVHWISGSWRPLCSWFNKHIHVHNVQY